MRMPKHATVVAYLALSVALGGTAYAATGGNFVLGHSNLANRTTSLKNSGTGPALKLSTEKNTTTPLAVSNDTKITHLNADQVDGLSSGAFQRKAVEIDASNIGIHSDPAGSVGPWSFSLNCNSNFGTFTVNGPGSVGVTTVTGGTKVADANYVHDIGSGYQAGFATNGATPQNVTLFLQSGSRFALAELFLMATNAEGSNATCKVVGAATLIS